jgi:DNA replication protein DnaC
MYIDKMLKNFRLLDIQKHYQDQIQLAIEKDLSYRDFLVNLLRIEEAGKKERLKERNIKAAHFENIKTLENFDFNFHKNLNKQKIKDLATLSFLEKKENIIFIGPPGVGKSHIATSIGIKACEIGKKVLYVTASELIDELFEAYKNGTFKIKFKKLSKIDLLIIDELGYFKMDKEKESIFFQLIRHRYEKSSLIITTNLPLGKWDEIFTSKLAATAVLDRLVHHSHIISITGDSYRVKGVKTCEKIVN